MKTFVFILLISVFASCNKNADEDTSSPREVTKEDSIKIQTEVEKEAASLKEKLEASGDGSDDEEKKLSIEFQLDTFRIHSAMRKYIEIDGSTSGMVDAGYYAEKAFDKLLNKYYKRILTKLSKEDQAVLKQSQRNWMAFRDSERKLMATLSEDKYSGGGTIQRIIYSSGRLELTKTRALELYSYLSGFYY